MIDEPTDKDPRFVPEGFLYGGPSQDTVPAEHGKLLVVVKEQLPYKLVQGKVLGYQSTVLGQGRSLNFKFCKPNSPVPEGQESTEDFQG